MFVTASMDGFIKMCSTADLQTKKCFFVSQSGLTAATALGQSSYALAGMNNEIYLFSFYQGTTMKQFTAHDDYITNVLCKSVQFTDGVTRQLLITTSADQTIKLWEISFGNTKQQPPKILYDHEEEITSAFVSQQPETSLLATVDLEGWVLVRDLKAPEDIVMKVKPEVNDYQSIEMANVCLNNHHQLNSGLQNMDDLFVSLNNQLFVYCLADHALVANPTYNANILKMR